MGAQDIVRSRLSRSRAARRKTRRRATASRRVDRARTAGRDARWVALYAVTFALEAAVGFVRFVFLTIPFTFIFAALGWVPITADGNTPVTWFCLALSATPLALSVLALIAPVGAGRYWRIRIGGRRPSDREREAYESAIDTLREHDPVVRGPRSWFVLDDWQVNAAALGDTLMVSTGTLQDAGLEAVLAHELAHLNTIDARLSVALNRFALPGAMLDRLTQACPDSTVVEFLHVIRWLWTGDGPLLLLRPLWDAWFRAREHAADEYAASLGQGRYLAEVLEREALPNDHPIPYRFLSGASHPATEHRLQVLRQHRRRAVR